MKRRDFLRSSGWFVVGATLSGVPGCGDNNDPPPSPDAEVPVPGAFTFPQGVASGDPRASSVVLWTRVQRAGSSDAVELRLQVSTDAAFSALFVDQRITATSDSDHTVRVLVTGLSANTTYFYRFRVAADQISGRTRTAPDPAADVQVNLAWVSCQDYGAGHYGAYRQMIVDDDARAVSDKIHVVLHLGDMIYETRANGFQTAIDENFTPIALTNADGTPRGVAAFPSGGGTRGTTNFAKTVDDYRHLYRTFLSDPDIREARARWPFVCVWDDHEFTNDCWQSQGNYTDPSGLDEGDQTRKVAANQAWFEYTPAHLTGATGVTGVPNEAKDFAKPGTVADASFTAPNADNFVPEPNNVAAVGSMTIYRSLRFGKHVELVMTDERSYRSDHAVPEDLVAAPGVPPGLFFDNRNAMPLVLVNTLDQGMTANGGNPPADVFGLPNPRAASPVGTMLGKAQKVWWKATMKGSTATWKVWGNEVPLMRLLIQSPSPNPFPIDRVVAADAWDGYPTERNELLTYLRTEAISNVVVLSGDIHSGYAGTLADNFDDPARATVACELVAPGISSNSVFSFFESATRPPIPAALRALITVDDSAGGGSKFTENLNLWLRHGTNSAGLYAQTRNLAQALAVADPTVNPHLRYCDTNCQGYGYAKVTGAQFVGTLVVINRPIAAPKAEGPGIKRTATFIIPAGNPAGMTGPSLTGTKPFPVT